MSAIKEYLPSLGLVIASVLSALSVALGDDRLQLGEALGLGVVLTTAVATYIVPRAPRATWLKPGVAAAGALFGALVMYLTDNELTVSEWPLVALAVLGALGVAVTNKQVPLAGRTYTARHLAAEHL